MVLTKVSQYGLYLIVLTKVSQYGLCPIVLAKVSQNGLCLIVLTKCRPNIIWYDNISYFAFLHICLMHMSHVYY
jgi:hypothetical protein